MVTVVAWLYGGSRLDVMATTIPWLFLFLIEMLIAFPQKAGTETSYEARARVWDDMKKDPLVWTAVGLLVLLAIPFVNNGLCVNCDRAVIAQGISPDPPIKFLPFCVNRMDHFHVFLWFATALSAMVATKHGLRRRGKRMLMKLVVWNGFALAILGFVQTATDAPGPLWTPRPDKKWAAQFFSSFKYVNAAGDYFTALFGIAVALWRRSCEDVAAWRAGGTANSQGSAHARFWKRHFYMVPAVVFFFAALNTLSRAAILASTILLAIFFIHAFISFTHRLRRGDKVRRGTIALGIVSLLTFFALVSLPDGLQKEIDTLDADTVLVRMTGKAQHHVRVATELWKEHILFGCGGWGYKHFAHLKMTDEELRVRQVFGGANVHNDSLQFLAEHGIVGFGAMVALVIMLLAPVATIWKQLAKAARFTDSRKAPPKPTALFALPAPAFCILAAATSTYIHSFGDCPLRSAAVLTLFYTMLAAIPGFLPKKEEEDNASRK